MRCRLLVLVALVGIGFAAGCNQSVCTRTTDCQASLVCSNLGQCVVPPDLAGTKMDDGDGGVDGGATSDLASSDDGAATTD